MNKTVFKKIILAISICSFSLTYSIIGTTVYASDSDYDIFANVMDSEGNESNIYYSELDDSVYETEGLLIDERIEGIPDASVNKIIGTDDRYVVPITSYTSSPYKMVCRIEVSLPNANGGYSSGHGTGFMVGPSTVLTACHVVRNEYGFTRSISVQPAAHHVSGISQLIYPYGVNTNFNTITTGLYYTTNNVDDDWALIDLNSSPGSSTGYFSVSSTTYNNMSVTLYGYHGDYYGEMGYSYGSISDLATSQFRHNCDSQAGSSGGPIVNSSNKVVGIHHGGNFQYNMARRITPYLVGLINDRL